MSTHRVRDYTPEQLAKGKLRMEIARRILIADRANSTWFEAMSRAGKPGQYMEKNWYARCRVAKHYDGLLFIDNTNWDAYLHEIENWPSHLWVSLLNTDARLSEAKACYGNNGTGKLAITTTADDKSVSMAAATWVPRSLKRANELEILAWLGPVGGEMPPPPPDQAPLFRDSTGPTQKWTVGRAITPVVVPAAVAKPAATYTVGHLPTGISFDAGTRTFSGTPRSTGAGTITVTATNSEGRDMWHMPYTIASRN